MKRRYSRMNRHRMLRDAVLLVTAIGFTIAGAWCVVEGVVRILKGVGR